MQNSITLKAKDVAPAAREWLASILQVDLTDDDEFTLKLHRPVRVPTPEQRATARQGLFEVLGRLAQRTMDVPEEEIDAAVHDAMEHVRLHKG